MSAILGILLIGLVIWFWLDGARAREIATAICDESCRRRGLQFLDQTVALQRVGIRWTGMGIRVRRMFRFDYSEEGVGRRDGHIVLVGIYLESFSLGLQYAESNEAEQERERKNATPFPDKNPADKLH